MSVPKLRLHVMLSTTKSFFPKCQFSARRMSPRGCDNHLFEYTSGRFLFNENIRQAERRVEFNIEALAQAVCRSVRRPVSDLPSITKFAEGGYNRVLQATFSDGYSIFARIPYNITVPKGLTVASEAATLGLLRSCNVPVPKVLGYSQDHKNPVGAAYLLLEKLEGVPLSDQWFSMDNKTRVKIMKQIVDIEKQYMTIALPASGSLYYRKDLDASQQAIPLSGQSEVLSSDQLVVGPTAQHEWWYKERALLAIDRGPWNRFSTCFEAPAKREAEFCRHFGKPRLHVERYLRELHHFQLLDPNDHVRLLTQYLELAPYLELPSSHRFSRPVLRHPDLSPNNILLDSSNKIIGIMDWQHAVALPLCLCAGIPSYFQNWGDPLSETLAKPDVKLPENFDQLDQSEQESIRETMRRRIVHFYYAALTLKQIPDHFDALRSENAMLRAKLFNRAGAPWEGDTLSLKYAMIQAYKHWPMALDDGIASSSGPMDCPVQYTEEEIQKCEYENSQEEEKTQELCEMRDLIGTDSLGWVPHEQFERSRELVHAIKAGLMEQSSIEMERLALRTHFPFDDHEEDT